MDARRFAPGKSDQANRLAAAAKVSADANPTTGTLSSGGFEVVALADISVQFMVAVFPSVMRISSVRLPECNFYDVRHLSLLTIGSAGALA